MFVKSTIVATSLALAAAAAYVQPMPHCATGPPQCCHALRNSQVADLAKIVSSVQAHVLPEVSLTGLEELAGFFGYACNPVGSDGSCMGPTRPVCCEYNAFNGMVMFGCTSATSNY